MIVGDPSIFAIESCITLAYERLSFRALGFFVVHIRGCSYGRRSPDSTMLASSFDEVERRLALRGSHVVPFASEPDAEKIARAFHNALYEDEQQENYFGIPLLEFSEMIWSKRIAWCPDGDEAFDDGSYVLQFDVQDRVRLIAFNCNQDASGRPANVSDLWIAADDFYSILRKWCDTFEMEWTNTPKANESSEALF